MWTSLGVGVGAGAGALLCCPQSPILLLFLVLVGIHANVRMYLIYPQKYACFLVSMPSEYVFLIDMYSIVLRSICGTVLPFFVGHHGFKISHVVLDTLSLPLLMTPR